MTNGKIRKNSALRQTLRDGSRPRNRKTVSELCAEKATLVKGGHILWPHDQKRVRLADSDALVLIHRALFEQANGPIPAGRFLLQACNVADCIAPDCWRVTTRATWSDVFRTHSGVCEPAKPSKRCAALASEGTSCVG